MKRLSDTRRNHKTAIVMLLLWLFAVSSGIVNACVLEPHGTDAHLAGVQPSTHATTAMAGHAETSADHEGPLDSSRAPCTKVCDDGSQTLIKQLPAFDLTDRGPALTDSIHWAVAERVVAPHRHIDTRRRPLLSRPCERQRLERVRIVVMKSGEIL